MNHIDYLLEHPFKTSSLEDKIKIKLLGSHQPLDFELKVNGDKQNRKFSTAWFTKTPWLTASTVKNSLFCFYCTLFGNDNVWTQVGYKDLKHLGDGVKKHGNSKHHLKCMLDFKFFNTVNIKSSISSAYAASILRHNETVQKNRIVLSRIIDILKFCGAHNLALRGHDEKAESANSGIFLGLVSYTRTLDPAFDDFLKNGTVVQNISKTIQNELLDCINKIYLNLIEEEIKETNFVALQADETTDVSCKSQLVLILRYVKDMTAVERFLGFYDLHDLSAKGLASVIKSTIKNYNLKEKLIAQTYDGAAVMSGSEGGVQTILRQDYPHAHFVHCYAHMFALILKKACCSIKQVRIFFAHLSGFSTFFSASSKRKNLLLEVCQRKGLPKTVETRWNFKSRVVKSVFESRENIIQALELIPIERWDDITIREASGLLKLLKDDEFNYFLNLFHKIFSEVDIFYNILQSRNCTGGYVQDKINSFTNSINTIRNNIDISCTKQNDLNPAKRIRSSFQALDIISKEICDIIITQIDIRFSKFDLITAFEVINPKEFFNYNNKFPSANVRVLVNYYSFLNFELLKSELTIIYSNEFFQKLNSVTELYKFIIENNLDFNQTKKLTEIVLTTPVTSAESERCFSTLKNIKTYKSSIMGQNRLNSLAILTIEKNLILKTANFTDRVIDLFASQKNRRAEYLFK